MKSNQAYIVKLIRQHDQSAFEYLWQQCSSSLLGVLLKSVRNEDTAHKLMGDLFNRIGKNIASFPDRGRLYNWMLNEARKTGIDYLKSRPLHIRE
jgi:RNA polymerase sigma-70 factor (ECF subfamily)